MAFPTKDTFTFDFEAQTDYPNWTPAQTKEYMNARGEELRAALNAVVDLLNATTSDASGADNTGIPEIIAGSGTNIRDRADWLYAQIVAAVLGAIPDGSLATIKYADGSVTAAKVAADVATQAELDDLAGVGRTTETVKGNADSLAIHQADYVYQVADGTATAITLTISETLVDGLPVTFIASANNSGVATTINTKPLYKPNTTDSPNLVTGKAYTVWYNLSDDCFFIKASAEGNAVAGDVLAGTTFSNDNDTGLPGTLALTGDAVTANVLSGKTFYSNNAKTKLTGTSTAKKQASGSSPFVENGSSDYIEIRSLTFQPSVVIIEWTPDGSTINRRVCYASTLSAVLNRGILYGANAAYDAVGLHTFYTDGFKIINGDMSANAATITCHWLAIE